MSPAPPNAASDRPDGLRSTPTRLRARDAEVFPEADRARVHHGVPTVYEIHVSAQTVRIVFDQLYLPPAMNARVAGLFEAYVKWWLETRQPNFPRHGISLGRFLDFCAVTVLREHGPWWIALFNEAATLSLPSPFRLEYERLYRDATETTRA
jgi:hypothetical protein